MGPLLTIPLLGDVAWLAADPTRFVFGRWGTLVGAGFQPPALVPAHPRRRTPPHAHTKPRKHRFQRYGPTFILNLMGVPLYVLTQPADLRGPYRDQGAEPDVPFSSFRRLMEVAPGRPYDVQADKAAHGPWVRFAMFRED